MPEHLFGPFLKSVPKLTTQSYHAPATTPELTVGRTSVYLDRLNPHRPGIRWSPRSLPRGLGQLDELELKPPPEIDLSDPNGQSLEDALNHQFLMVDAQFRSAERIEELRRKVMEKEREYWERKEGYKMLDSASVEFWESLNPINV
ncbi:hypothetical protein RUND412_007502 [Rhizina undulata]